MYYDKPKSTSWAKVTLISKPIAFMLAVVMSRLSEGISPSITQAVSKKLS